MADSSNFPSSMSWPELSEEAYKKVFTAIRRVLQKAGAPIQDIECITQSVLKLLRKQPYLFKEGNLHLLIKAAVCRSFWMWKDLVREGKKFMDLSDPLDRLSEPIDLIDDLPQKSVTFFGGGVENEPEQACLEKELLDYVLAFLTDDERQVFELHILQGHTIKEVALIVRGSDDKRAQSWVSQVKKRAIKKLRSNSDLSEYLGYSSAIEIDGLHNP